MPERQAIDHATVGSDRPGIEALAPDDDVHEVEGRLGRGGEGAAPVSVSVHPRPADDVDDAALRGRPFVMVIVAHGRVKTAS
jgi:hypothetical protein